MNRVEKYLAEYGKDSEIRRHEQSTATVELAAAAFGIEPGQIAKTLAFRKDGGGALLVVYAGNVRVDNRKFKDTFGYKPKMLSAEETEIHTGFVPGGVCPFALPDEADVALYLDVSLQAWETVWPACGDDHSGIPLTPQELMEISRASGWVDTAK